MAAVTVGEGEGSETLQQIAAAAFASWVDQIAERLTAAGLAPGEAAELASLLIALLEGAHVMCRASRTIEPFDRAAHTAIALARSRYAEAASG